MKPIATEETNFVYELPGGDRSNDLPCVRDLSARTVKSTWELDDSEAALFESEAAGLFLQVGAHDVRVRVQHEGIDLMLEPVVTDDDGTLYVVGAAGVERESIARHRRVDLTVHSIPTPPVALWVQVWPAAVDQPGDPNLPPQRWNIVFEGHGLTEEQMRQKLDVLTRCANELGLIFTDLDHLPALDGPEDLDAPDTKGA